MGSQKVTGMLVLHCNGRINNINLFTFKIKLARAHTHTEVHLLHSSRHCWKHLRKLLGSSRVRRPHLILCCPWLRNSSPWGLFCQKSLGARFGEYGGWMTTGIIVSAKNCCTTSDAWLGALSWCRNRCPCHLSRRFLRATSHRNLCQTCAWK
jgi:hypothetical protein